MAKRTTKAQAILNELRNRMQKAQNEVVLAEQQLSAALAIAKFHEENYGLLEAALAPKPRSPKSQKSTAPSAEKKSSRKGAAQTLIPSIAGETESVGTVSRQSEKVHLPVACLICGYDEDYQDHFQPSPNYHAFDSSAKTKKGKAA